MRALSSPDGGLVYIYRMFTTRNPVDQSIIKHYQTLTKVELELVIHSAQEAQHSWRATSIADRKLILGRLGHLISSKKQEYARLITLEMGKVLPESIVEIQKCKTMCDFLVQNLDHLLLPKEVERTGERAYVRFDPLGGVLGIMPWNFPFWQVFRFALPALSAGNAVFLKHAPNTLGCGEALQDLFTEAGYPKGLFQHLIMEIDLVEPLIEHPFVQAVSLTGSERAGSAVASIAGKNIKKTVLELGGSDPFIVLEDADFSSALSTAVKSRMINCGQSCIAAKRFFVHEKIYSEFVNAFTQEMHALIQGNPEQNGVHYGPMARVDLVDQLLNQIEKSIQMGAKPSRTDYYDPDFPTFIKALVLTQLHFDMPVMKEEVFGPVAAIMPFSSDEQVIDYANRSDYGLGSSIWTQDMQRARHLAEKLESGSVYINTLMKSDVSLPFGGVKRSGYGRELSTQGFYEFVNIKSVVEA